jgi:imidazolonepropionase-like amidohydrolase
MSSISMLKSLQPLIIILAVSTSSYSQESIKNKIIIAASVVLDGKGGRILNTHIVIKDGIIVSLDPNAEPVDYDLRGLTVLPGWIDAHTHIGWGFGPDGKNVGNADTTQWGALSAASNAYATLMGGFTTIQSVGSKFDLNLREAINKGILPGPRILTSLEPIIGADLTPDEIRALVRKRKQEGADLIKIIASGGMTAPGLTLGEEQLIAACDEARKQGLRSLVHANTVAVKVATLAGCSQIEHGRMATDEELKLMAERQVFFDPQGGLLMENYFVNRAKFAGTPFFPDKEEVLAQLYYDIIPGEHDLIKRAYKVPDLKIVFGSDAVAGMHGKNAEEFIHRVRDGGVNPMTALISANATGAKAIGKSDEIGIIARGMRADIIALCGDPLKDITVVRKVVFVMKGGIVYKNLACDKGGN